MVAKYESMNRRERSFSLETVESIVSNVAPTMEILKVIHPVCYFKAGK